MRAAAAPPGARCPDARSGQCKKAAVRTTTVPCDPLLRSGFLGHFITGPRALQNERWMERVYPFRQLWVERKLADIPPAHVKRLWLPEIAQKMTKRLGGSGELSNWIHNELFAREAAL